MEQTEILTTVPSLSLWQRIKSALKNEAHFTIGIPAIIWQILFFYLPLATMLLTSFVDVETKRLTLSHYALILQGCYFKIIGNSLLLSSTTTIICFLIGFPLAHFIAFRAGRFRTLLLFLLIIPFWTNFLLHIYAWFFVLENQGFINSILMSTGLLSQPLHILNTQAAVLLMMVYYFLPFMVLPIYFSLERFNPYLLEASADLGATKIQTYRRILFPLTLPSIRGGFLLVFIPAFGEFIIPEIMGGNRVSYVGIVISEFVLGENTAPIGTAFTVISICTLIIITAGLFYLFKKIEETLVR